MANDNVVLVDSSGGARNVTLPAPSSGRSLKIKDSTGSAATNNITLLPNAAELIDGASSKVINSNYGSLEVVSDGTNWFLELPPNGIGVTTVGTFGSSPTANAATISGSTITIQPADGSNPGAITAGTQTIGGVKTLSSRMGVGTSSTFSALNIQGTSLLSSSLQIAVWNQMTYSSAATDNDTSGFATTVATENASFTTGHFKHFNANQITKGASNTITRLSGLYVNSAAVTAGTNNAYIADNNSYSGDWAINFSNTRASSLGGALSVGGDLKVTTAGKGLFVAEGSNAKMGTATLSAGTVTVSTTAVTANSRIFLTVQSLGTVTTPKAIAVTAKTASTSFVITSEDVTDTSVVAWMIVEPA